MSDKPRVAFTWCGSCGGCEESLLDLAEALPALLEAVDLAFCPALVDYRRKDVEAVEDGGLAIGFVNGCIRTTEHAAMARLLRRKCRTLVAYGSCAQAGGVPALADLVGRESLLRAVYRDAITVDRASPGRPDGAVPDRAAGLPQLLQRVRALDQVVVIDYYLPGCPPTPELLRAALSALLSESPPARGSVLAPDISLCEGCPRRGTRPAEAAVAEFRRAHLAEVAAGECFLGHGVICMGPATRSGCDAACLKAGAPCTGCFGPTSRVGDQGAKMVSAVASMAPGASEKQVVSALEGIPDPVGTFYRYVLARSAIVAAPGCGSGDRQRAGAEGDR